MSGVGLGLGPQGVWEPPLQPGLVSGPLAREPATAFSTLSSPLASRAGAPGPGLPAHPLVPSTG